MIYPNISNGQRGTRTVVAYPDFVAEDLGWWPRDTSLIFVDTIDKEGSSPPNVVDRILNDGFDSGRFNDDVESERVVLLQLIPLRLRVLPKHR